jgi:hypothetical protein
LLRKKAVDGKNLTNELEYTSCPPGGAMYKLNFFSKELSDFEVEEMARDRCGAVEESYGDVRHIRWEYILSQTWNGNVTEITQISCISRFLETSLDSKENQLRETIAKNHDLEAKLQQLSEYNLSKNDLFRIQMIKYKRLKAEAVYLILSSSLWFLI